MGKVTLDEETIDGAVRGIDSGRRVGWAKAFEALRRADSAERDVNVLRADNRLLAAFAARAYGALEVTCRHRITELFRGDNNELKTFFPDGPLQCGRDAMRQMLGRKADELNEVRRQVKEAEAGREELRAAAHDKMFAAAKRKERAALMEEYGIPTEDELLRWLGLYRGSEQ